MPRRRQPARLYLRKARGDRAAMWVVRDGEKETSTGAAEHECGKAEKALQDYLAKNHRPRDSNQPGQLLVAEVMNAYLTEHAPTRVSARWIADMAADIADWWGDKTLAEVNARSCRAYVAWRTSQPIATIKKKDRLVGVQTARGELSILRAAINFYHREHGPLASVPMVTLPPKKPAREGYFLSRDQIAARLRAARRRHDTHHIARLILVGLYSGTRPGAMMRLRWLPSTDGGWVDLGEGIIHRRGQQASRTKKRQPPVRIHDRLLPHLRR